MLDTIQHAEFCLPRPGDTEPRTESYRAERYNEDGTHVVARPLVTRCQECGEQVVEG